MSTLPRLWGRCHLRRLTDRSTPPLPLTCPALWQIRSDSLRVLFVVPSREGIVRDRVRNMATTMGTRQESSSTRSIATCKTSGGQGTAGGRRTAHDYSSNALTDGQAVMLQSTVSL